MSYVSLLNYQRVSEHFSTHSILQWMNSLCASVHLEGLHGTWAQPQVAPMWAWEIPQKLNGICIKFMHIYGYVTHIYIYIHVYIYICHDIFQDFYSSICSISLRTVSLVVHQCFGMFWGCDCPKRAWMNPNAHPRVLELFKYGSKVHLIDCRAHCK